MPQYQLNPYVHLIEDRVVPSDIQFGIVHRLTGEVTRLSNALRSFLLEADGGLWIDEQDLAHLTTRSQLKRLIENEFLIAAGFEPLQSFLNYYVVRPKQNPAVVYRATDGRIMAVHTSMEGFEFSPRLGDFPPIIEEELPPPADQIFLYADGTLTLRDMSARLDAENAFKDPLSMGFEKAIDFLTASSRQLIKFAPDAQHLDNPYKPFNSVPRNLSHSFKIELDQNLPGRLNDFHQKTIADASWEFDWIEPTLNHAFRFPSDVIEGQDYGSRFCNATLSAEIITFPTTSPLEVLEVGGGTGSFAVSFLRQASQVSQTSTSPVTLNYHIVDLSPALMVNQQALHSAQPTKVTYLQQNAVELDIPG